MPGCVSEISKDPNFIHLIQECGEACKLTVGETRQNLQYQKRYLSGLQKPRICI